MVDGIIMRLMPSCSVQFMGDIVQPASKDAGGIVHGTVTDLKDQVSMSACPLKCRLGLWDNVCAGGLLYVAVC